MFNWKTYFMVLMAVLLIGCALDEPYDDEFFDEEFDDGAEFDDEFADDEFFDDEEFDDEPLDDEPLDDEFEDDAFEDEFEDESETDAEEFAAVNFSVPTDDIRILEFDTKGDSYLEASFSIEADDVSFLIYARAADVDELVYFTELLDPSGEFIYLADLDSNEVDGPAFGDEWLENQGEAALYLPTAPQFELESGEYQVVVQTDGSPLTEAGVIIRSGVVDDQVQALDINIWPVTTSATFADEGFEETFAAAIRRPMDELLQPHDLMIGNINFFAVTDADVDEYAEIRLPDDEEGDGRNYLADVCLTAGQVMGSGRAVNLVIVDQILNLDGEDTGTAGISSGLPGTVLMADSPQSCVIVSWFAFEDSYEEQAGNIIHEASHLMSLTHTSEADGAFFDPFTDTPECDIDSYDNDGDEEVDEFECDIEGGARNYMFYSGDISFAPFEMSADQAWTLRRHLLFYPAD